MANISGATFTINALELDYPIVEAITAALEVCDEVIVFDAESTDGTPKMLQDVFDERVKVYSEPWPFDKDNPEGRYRTDLIRKCTKDWIYLFDADEVLHEDHYGQVKCLIEEDREIYMFGLLNLYRCQSEGQYKILRKTGGITSRPFLIHNGKGIYFGRSKGGMCPHKLLVDNPPHYRHNALRKLPKGIRRDIKVFHYSQCRYGAAIARSLNFWADHYSHIGSKNEKYYDEAAFKLKDRTGEYKEFKGEHPVVMKRWLERHA